MAEPGDPQPLAAPSNHTGSRIAQPATGGRLNSWKEIAQYIGRDVRTAHRWEQNNGLPVHRLMHDKNATVFALTTEIDDWLAKRSSGPQVAEESKPEPRTVRHLWILGAVLSAGAAAVAVWQWEPKGQFPPQLRTPTPLTAEAGWEWEPQLSPDGRSVAYTRGDRTLGPQVVVQLIGGGQAVPIAGPERNTHSPTWSSDGNSIALLRQHPERPDGASDLIVMPAFGGAERKIAQLVAPIPFSFRPGPSIDWSLDGRFLAVSDQHRIKIVSMASGEIRTLTAGVEKMFGDYSPRFSPDGRRIAFTRVAAYGISDVFVLDLTSDMRPSGSPRRIPSGAIWNAAPVWTPDGRRLIFISGTLRTTRLSIADSNGKTPARLLPVLDSGIGPLDVASMGRNQLRLVYTRFQQDSDIWKIPLNEVPVRPVEVVKVVDSSYLDIYPRFSPDETKFAFVSNRSGNEEVWIANSDGTRPFQLTKLQAGTIGRPAWSPDGRRIAFELHAAGASGIYQIGIADGRVQQFVPGGASEGHPDFSLDGKWLYFSSKRSGAERIWKIPTSGGEPVLVFDQEARAPLLLPAQDGVLYVGQGAGIWLQPLPGGQPLKIFDEVYSAEHVDVTQAGVYGLVRWGKGSRETLAFYSFARRQVQDIYSYAKPATGGLSVSRDGRYALASMRDHVTIDLMMVDSLEIGSF